MNPWLLSTIESARDLAQTCFDSDLALEGVEQSCDLVGVIACFVALVGENMSMHLGIAATEQHGKVLAQLFQGEELPLSVDDVADALGEMVNIVAGGVKKRTVAEHSNLRLGLPLVIRGELRATGGEQISHVRARVGGAQIWLVTLRGREAVAAVP